MLANTDYVLFDLKLMDEQQHLFHTGKTNRPILKNFDMLVRSGVAFVPRVPLIPGATDTQENLTAIAKLLQGYNIKHAELLPYNQMAGSKYKLAGKEFRPTYDPKVACRSRIPLFEDYGIKVQVY